MDPVCNCTLSDDLKPNSEAALGVAQLMQPPTTVWEYDFN